MELGSDANTFVIRKLWLTFCRVFSLLRISEFLGRM
jgi:hypothetical protein